METAEATRLGQPGVMFKLKEVVFDLKPEKININSEKEGLFDQHEHKE